MWTSYHYDQLSPMLILLLTTWQSIWPSFCRLWVSQNTQLRAQMTLYINSDNKKYQEIWKLISFDVTALFTNVPLLYTIDIILDRIYNRKELNTEITRNELKESNIQTDGVAMGSPLGPVIAGIFMVELEQKLLPELSTMMTPWFRYVDDTINRVN